MLSKISPEEGDKVWQIKFPGKERDFVSAAILRASQNRTWRKWFAFRQLGQGFNQGI